jgi:hypothetical protein
MFGHITQAQWDKHPSFRQDLKALLTNPVFQTALEIVLDKGMKTTTLSPHEPLAFAGLMGARKDGYIEALANLFALTESASDAPAVLTPWKTPPPEKPASQT